MSQEQLKPPPPIEEYGAWKEWFTEAFFLLPVKSIVLFKSMMKLVVALQRLQEYSIPEGAYEGEWPSRRDLMDFVHLDGHLSGTRYLEISAHLRECPRCTKAVLEVHEKQAKNYPPQLGEEAMTLITEFVETRNADIICQLHSLCERAGANPNPETRRRGTES